MEFYGGKDTAGWQHEVAGEHGRPSYGAFNIDQFSRCRVEIPEYVRVVVTGEELADRLHGYEFGGVTTIGFKGNAPMKKRTKEHMTSLINRGFQAGTLLLPIDDVEIEDQFTTQTYTMAGGKVVYSKGNDHIVDAVRCAVLAREQEGLDDLSEVAPCLMPLETDPVFW